MSTSRSNSIDQIIQKRRPLANKIQRVEAKLESLAEKLGYFEAHRQNLIEQVKSLEIKQRLEGIDISRCKDDIAEELKTLKKLRTRFERPTLNIGVVGRMGQGKSTLLQHLSGLTNDEIPARSGRACTAVRSVLYHHEGETKTSVVLHSEESLLKEVIHEYWKELGWQESPISLDAFARMALPSSPGGAVNDEMYKHLKDYHDHLDKYNSPLQTRFQPEGNEIPKQDISEYVTQQRDGQDRLITFKHLAVKEVKIHCRFSKADVGKIALVDVPGLGDTKLGDEALMLKTLGQEVDVVLFVRRPDSLRYQWEKEDAALYDKAAKELNQLAQRAFMVLNHQVDNGDNLQACRDLKQSIPFEVVECLITDCSDDEAANQLLDTILNHLNDRITSLDEEYTLSVCKYGLKQIQNSVSVELEKAQNAYGDAGTDEAWADRLDDLFEELWEDLAGSLKAQLNTIRERRNEPDPAFVKQIEETLQLCRKETGIPSLEVIQRRMFGRGGPQSAYELCLNEVRLNLSQKFISLDQGLKQSLDQVKRELAEVLAKAGHLAGLSQSQGAEFLRDIAQQIPDELQVLKQVFQTFSNFDLLYRGMIQHRIRPHLDTLTPGMPNCPQTSKSPTALELFETLEALQQEAVYNCEKALKGSQQTRGLLEEPSQAVFAIAEEFVDGVLWAKDVKGQWKKFLRRVRSKAWAGEFDPEPLEARREWQRLIERIEDANQLDIDHFLN